MDLCFAGFMVRDTGGTAHAGQADVQQMLYTEKKTVHNIEYAKHGDGYRADEGSFWWEGRQGEQVSSMGVHAGLLQAVVWRTQVLTLPQRPAHLNKLTLNLYDKRQTSRVNTVTTTTFFKTPFGKSGSCYQTGSDSLFTK